MQKSILLAAIQKEIQRHDLLYFVDEPPSIAQGGNAVVVSGGYCGGTIFRSGTRHDTACAFGPGKTGC
jgi:hypothetical protein